MIQGQLSAPGQLTDPGVNFALVHGLTPITVHMSFFVAPGQLRSRGGSPVVQHRVTPPCRGNFSPCEQNTKVAPGPEQSCACTLLMFEINFLIKSPRKQPK